MLNFIGRGSSFNQYVEGSNSAFLKFNDGKNMILIDCGETTSCDIQRLGLLDGVENLYVAITHTHPDHIGSLGSLIFYCNYKMNINVFIYVGDTHIAAKTISYLDSVCIPKSLYKMTNSVPYIYAFSMLKHDEMTDTQAIILYIPITDEEQSTILYTGDTNDKAGLVFLNSMLKQPVVYTDCTLAEHDGNVHMSLSNLMDIFPDRASRSKVYCMHLDNQETIDECIKAGFNVVENYITA